MSRVREGVQARGRARRQGAGTDARTRLACGLAGLGTGLLLWQLVALRSEPTVFPSPLAVARAGADLLRDGVLAEHVGISVLRMVLGFLIGSAVAIPVGLLMSASDFAKAVIEPYINFFRAIPAISLVVFAVIWFGIGEASKVFLILYNAFFAVAINTEAGARSVPLNRIRMARCLGAGRLQTFLRVVLPSTVPHIFAGMRIAMGRSFSTIVAAEMLAASAGIGYLIFASRQFMKTDTIFLALIALGTLGFTADRLLRFLISRLGREYVAGADGQPRQ